MYHNIGKRIKILAQICGIAFLAVGVLGGLWFVVDGRWTNDGLIAPFLGGGVLGFISSWPLYGLGELIENVKIIAVGKAKDVEVEKEPEKENAQ